VDGAVLPLDVQRLIARACAEARFPWERPDRLDVQLAFTATETTEDLVASGRLDAALASRLADAYGAPIALPRLQDRPEDLRAILTDRLAREGLRVLGRPVGIEPAAYARIAEHTFPGEEAELSALVQRLVARCATSQVGGGREGDGADVVTAADLDALRLFPVARARDGKRRKDPLSA
jgi:DNA-binding NtrC family response regulator